jgi:uncharacterized membrane protein
MLLIRANTARGPAAEYNSTSGKHLHSIIALPGFAQLSLWPSLKTVAQIYQSALLVGLGLIILAILGALIGRIVRRGNISLVVSAS